MTETGTSVDSQSSDSDTEAQNAAQPGDAEAPPVASLDLDRIFEVLQNERRRMVVEYLLTHEGPVEIGELSEELAARENDKEVREITSAERKRVYVGLYQAHLPKMDGMDVVTFDKGRGTVEKGPNFDELLPYLGQEGATPGRDWATTFAAVSVASLAGLVGVAVLATLTTLPVFRIWAILSLAAFGAISVLFYRNERA